MEFGEKLQGLRKNKGMTQEELAEKLFVSRAAVSKWESGRGYPNIDSLKALAEFFDVTVDELLSVAHGDAAEKQKKLRRIFGALDMGALLFFVLPLFAGPATLLGALSVQPYMKAAYFAVVCVGIICGILELTAVKYRFAGLSLGLSAAGTMLFIVSRQPYAAAFMFAILAIKAVLLAKKR